MPKLSDYLIFDGRIARLGFWKFRIALIFLFWLIATVEEKMSGDIGVFTIVFVFLSIWPSVVNEIHRWHDRGKSGWWFFLKFIPIIGPIWTIVELGFFPSVEHDSMFD